MGAASPNSRLVSHLFRSAPASPLPWSSTYDIRRFQRYDASEPDDDGDQKGVACAAHVRAGTVASLPKLSSVVDHQPSLFAPMI